MYDTKNMARVLRRMIGKVDVFDMSGSVKGDNIARIREYVNAYVKQGNVRYAIINVQELAFVDNNSVDELLNPLKGVDKTVLFCDDDDMCSVFECCDKHTIDTFCRSEREVVEILGEQLLNIKSPIPFKEKRSALRLQSALSVEVIYKLKNMHDDIITHGIITNISERGAFVEYLDLKSAVTIGKLDYFKNVEVHLHTRDKFFKGQNLVGEIVRVEMSGKHTSVAVRFFDEISLASLY